MFRILKSVIPSGGKGCFLNGEPIDLDSDLSHLENELVESVSIYCGGFLGRFLVFFTATKLITVKYVNNGAVKLWMKNKEITIDSKYSLNMKYKVVKKFKVYDVLLYFLEYAETRKYSLLWNNCRCFTSELIQYFKCEPDILKKFYLVPCK